MSVPTGTVWLEFLASEAQSEQLEGVALDL